MAASSANQNSQNYDNALKSDSEEEFLNENPN